MRFAAFILLLLGSFAGARLGLAHDQPSTVILPRPPGCEEALSDLEWDELASESEIRVELGPEGPYVVKLKVDPHASTGVFHARAEPPATLPSDVLRKRQLLGLLKKEGYEIINSDYDLGTEGFIAHVKDPQGIPFILKIGRREQEALQVEGDTLLRVRAHAEQTGREGFFPAARVIRLAAAPESPMLLLALVRRNPESAEPAPTLRSRLNSGLAGLSADAKIRLVRQLAEAVDLAHSVKDPQNPGHRGIIHRDLKPENILVDDAGNITVIDWGMSAWQHEYPPGLGDSVLSGTLNYMDRNQLDGKPASEGNDIEAVRRISFEILGAGENLTPHVLLRPFVGTIDVRDYKHAPELPGVDPRLAVAVWDRSASTMEAYRHGIEQASALEPSAFYRWYGRQLMDADAREAGLLPLDLAPARVAARSILESKTLIAQFPSGLGLTAGEAAAVVRGYRALQVESKHKLTLSGAHAHMYFTLFEARLRELEL